MKAKASEIKLDSFVILQSQYSFLPPKRKPRDIEVLFRKYELDIDFAHQMNEKGKLQVFTKIAVNQVEKPYPGYRLFVEGAGVFSIDELPQLPSKEQNNLKYFTSVNILIGYLRNTMVSITASAPLGPYLLPPINMADLFEKKTTKTKKNTGTT